MFDKSLIYITKNSCPTIDPCETPAFLLPRDRWVPFKTTLYFVWQRKSVTSFRNHLKYHFARVLILLMSHFMKCFWYINKYFSNFETIAELNLKQEILIFGTKFFLNWYFLSKTVQVNITTELSTFELIYITAPILNWQFQCFEQSLPKTVIFFPEQGKWTSPSMKS